MDHFSVFSLLTHISQTSFDQGFFVAAVYIEHEEGLLLLISRME